MRILIATFGSYGDLNPYIGLALALRRRGHDPVLATSDFYREDVEREGIRFHPMRPDIDPGRTDIVARIMDVRRGPEFLLKDLVLAALPDSYADLSEAARNADLIVSHPLTFAIPIIAQERDIPWISSVLAPMSFFSRSDIPVLAPLPWLKQVERVSQAAAGWLLGVAQMVTRHWPEPVYRLRRERGLDAGKDPLYDGQHSPFGVLALFSKLLAAPQPDWPARVHVTGHIFYNGRHSGELPEELERFLAEGPPPVVFTLGSSAVYSAGDFYEQSIEGVRMLKRRSVLLVGRDPRNRPRQPLGGDVLAIEFAPHELLFPRAAAIVHQGGIGTTAQALRSGKPMLVVPFSFDQPDNAWRVQRLGVARTLYAAKYRASRLVRELRPLLEDSRYTETARSVADIVRNEPGVDAACDVIEDAAGRRRRP